MVSIRNMELKRQKTFYVETVDHRMVNVAEAFFDVIKTEDNKVNKLKIRNAINQLHDKWHDEFHSLEKLDRRDKLKFQIKTQEKINKMKSDFKKYSENAYNLQIHDV